MEVYTKTDIGKVRESNQDSLYVLEEDLPYKLYILADGMGGYAGGEIASSLAVSLTKKYITNSLKNNEIESSDIKQIIKEAIEYANMMVNEKAKQDENYSEMGTTLDVALIYKDRIYIGHVGDSRIYRIRKDIIRQLTLDHTYVQKLLKDGTITKEEADNHPKRHMLIKAIGTEKLVSPDIIEKKILKDDIIIMCSDGLSNMLNNNEIYNISKCDNMDIAEQLVKKANENGGTDNITVIAVKI